MRLKKGLMRVKDLKNWIAKDGKIETQVGPKYFQLDSLRAERTFLGFIFGLNAFSVCFRLTDTKDAPQKPEGNYSFHRRNGDHQHYMDFVYTFWFSSSWDKSLKELRDYFAHFDGYRKLKYGSDT